MTSPTTASHSNHFTIKWIPPILSYCAASISMTLTNKLVLSGFHFKLPFLMLAVQSISTVLLLMVFTLLGLTTHRGLNRKDAERWFPVSLLMAAMLYTGSKALQHLSVPIVTIVKNLSIILIAYGESRVFGGHVTPLMLVSFLMMVLSSIIGAHADLTHTWSDQDAHSATVAGYFWLISNCFVSSSFVLFMRYTIRSAGNGQQPFKDFDTVLYNNTLSAPIFLILSLFGADGNLGDFFSYYSDPANGQEMRAFMWALALSGAFAFFISYASAWCMRVTNSTTYSMVGALNKLPIAISGMIMFSDPVTTGSVGSILIGFCSGLLYTVAKLKYDADQKQLKILPTSITEEKPVGSMQQPLTRISPAKIVNYLSAAAGGAGDESVMLTSNRR